MDTSNITKQFKKMKADFKFISDGARASYNVNVEGGVFSIMSAGNETIENIQVVDIDIKDRHILLNVSTKTDKGKIDKAKWLCGHDERDWFVGAVPGVAKNIWEAKQNLKPEEVREAENSVSKKKKQNRKNKARIRQGEWFFIPATISPDAFMILKDEPISRGNGSKPHVVEEVYRTGGTTVYVSTSFPTGITQKEYDKYINGGGSSSGFRVMTRDASVYGRGYVKHKDHATINLVGWHKIIMNTENLSKKRSNLAFLD